MGCWNETDMLSRLPVMEGDLSLCIILAERPGHVDATRPDGSWFPVAVPVLGRYDGYGSLEDIRDVAKTAAALDGLRAFWLDGDGIRHDLRCGASTEDVSEYLASIHDRECFIQYEDASDGVTEARICTVFVLREFHALAQDAYVRYPSEDPDRHPAFNELEQYMNRLRIAWGPTNGSGSQAGIEDQAQLLFYETLHAKAMDIYKKWHDKEDCPDDAET